LLLDNLLKLEKKLLIRVKKELFFDFVALDIELLLSVIVT